MARRARSIASDPPIGNSDGENPDGGNRGVNSGVPDTDAATGGDSGTVINPASVGGSDNDSEPRQRKQRSDRGKPRGARSEKADKIDLGDFAQILSEIHSGIAMMANIPELALDEASGEHTKLARAIERVKRHYDLPNVSPIAVDWFMLAKTAGLIYGSRIIAYNLRQRAENARPINQPAQVQTSAPAAPAAPKAPNAPPVQPAQPVRFTPPPGAVRAAPIPGFENVDIVVPQNPNTRQ